MKVIIIIIIIIIIVIIIIFIKVNVWIPRGIKSAIFRRF